MFRTQELALILSCVAGLGGYPVCYAQSNPSQKPQTGDLTGKVTSFPATTGAQFSPVPITTPVYATNPYAGYKGRYGGYLSGGADVINAQGQFMVSTQQAYQMR